MSGRQTASTQEATITSCTVGPGHDGRAEVVVEIVYPNGGRSWLSIGEEALGRVVDAAGLTSLAQLIGQPWTVLLAGLELAGITGHPSPSPGP